MKSKIIYGILAVFVSIGLWLYVVTVVNPEWEETFYDIPVVLENQEILHERGLMLVSENQPKVNLRLNGNRTDMIKLNNANITIRADLSRIYSAGEQRLSYSISYPESLPNNAFTIVSQEPQQITLSVVERKSKPVDVVLKVGNLEQGYIALTEEAEAELADKKITVSGPAEVVDRIVSAEIAIDLAGQKETINREFTYVLRDAEGNAVENKWLKATPEKLSFTLKIQKQQEVNLGVDILEGAGLTVENCKVTLFNQETGEALTNKIIISGSETQLAVLRGAGLLRGDVLYLDKKVVLGQMPGELTEDGKLQIVLDVNLSDMLAPYEITNRSMVNIVRVVVEIPGQSVREVRVSKFTAQTDLTAKYQEEYIEVTLRGPQYLLTGIDERSLMAQVDLTGATPNGSYQMFSVTVEGLPNGVYAVGSYTVNATVS